MRGRAQLALALALAWTAPAAAEPEAQGLFRIERSKNANVVQYDARIAESGRLDPKQPVVAYWIRLAKDGERRDLKWIERRFAYGFTARYDAETDEATLALAADIGRKLRVYAADGRYRAATPIDGRPAYISRIYIESDESGALPRVIHIDLWGRDVESGEERYERFVPE